MTGDVITGQATVAGIASLYPVRAANGQAA